MKKYIGRFKGEKLKPVSHRTMLGGEAYQSTKHYVMIEPTRTSSNWFVAVLSLKGSTKPIVKRYVSSLSKARKYVKMLGFK